MKNLPPETTFDAVKYKFESKRSVGAEVESVQMDLQKRIALVKFEDYNGKFNLL